MCTSHVSAPVQSPGCCTLGRTARWPKDLVSCCPQWETQVEVHDPGCGLDQPRLLWSPEQWASGWKVCPSVNLNHSARCVILLAKISRNSRSKPPERRVCAEGHSREGVHSCRKLCACSPSHTAVSEVKPSKYQLSNLQCAQLNDAICVSVKH